MVVVEMDEVMVVVVMVVVVVVHVGLAGCEVV